MRYLETFGKRNNLESFHECLTWIGYSLLQKYWYEFTKLLNFFHCFNAQTPAHLRKKNKIIRWIGFENIPMSMKDKMIRMVRGNYWCITVQAQQNQFIPTDLEWRVKEDFLYNQLKADKPFFEHLKPEIALQLQKRGIHNTILVNHSSILFVCTGLSYLLEHPFYRCDLMSKKEIAFPQWQNDRDTIVEMMHSRYYAFRTQHTQLKYQQIRQQNKTPNWSEIPNHVKTFAPMHMLKITRGNLTVPPMSLVEAYNHTMRRIDPIPMLTVCKIYYC